MSSVKEQIHAQIAGALAGAVFPIDTQEKLIAAFPAGAETTCQVGRFENDSRGGRETSKSI